MHVSPEEEERTIRELDRAWSAALQDKDLDTVMTNYADDAVLLPPNAPIVEGKQRIREWFAQRIALPGYAASFRPTRIAVSTARDMAYEIGAFQVTVLGQEGLPVTRVGKHLVTWEKRGGRWHVTAESLNQDQP